MNEKKLAVLIVEDNEDDALLLIRELRRGGYEPDALRVETREEMQEALQQLPAEHREALILVGAAGLSYEEAAEICGCALGTIKSRVNRARARLLKIMDAEDASDVMALETVAVMGTA